MTSPFLLLVGLSFGGVVSHFAGKCPLPLALLGLSVGILLCVVTGSPP